MDKEIYDLRVNSMINPAGVEEAPYFSWKMKSDENGAAQTAYKLIVSDAEGAVIYDGGFTASDRSYGIRCGKMELKPETRYFWRVFIKDENGAEIKSGTAYFETGLSGWDGAEWIGAPRKTYNTGGIRHYKISVDFSAPDGYAGVVIAARGRGNYFLIGIDTAGRNVKITEYNDNAWSGSRESGVMPYVGARGKKDGYAITEDAVTKGAEADEHRLSVEVNGADVTLKINGVTVIDAEPLIPEAPPLYPYKQRMFMFGFRQDSGTAVYDNLKIETLGSGAAVLLEDGFDGGVTNCSFLGETRGGKLFVKERFSLTCAVPAINVRKSVSVGKGIKSARLYASARGFYDIYINGEKVNESFYNPGFTDYHMHLQYQTYDVTDRLGSGANVIGAVIGSGYYSGFLGYNSMPMIYGTQSSFIAKLAVTYEDEERETFITDGSWQFTDCGPVVCGDYLNGEFYDARRSFDWLDMSSDIWESCGILPGDDFVSPANGRFEKPVRFEFRAQQGPEAGIYRTAEAKYIGECPKGHFVYDVGQNIVGTVRVRLKGAAGTVIKLRYGEMRYKSGEVYLRNLRAAYNTDIYIMKGGETEEFIPTFTSHGFRYIEISGDGEELADNSVVVSAEGLVITNTREAAGYFECSDENVNKLYNNILWGQIGNSLLVYTDCPQRNERMGWTGDAQIFSRTAAYNMNIRAFMDKCLLDIRDAQIRFNMDGGVPDTAPLGGDNRGSACLGWGDAAVIIPREMYLAYGDIEILRKNYPMMRDWVNHIMSPEMRGTGVRTVNGVRVPEKSDLAREPYIQLQQRRGDHLTADSSTPFILTATAYSARTLAMMSEIAEILGKDEDKAEYEELFGKVKRAFCDAWVKEDGSIAYWGEMSRGGINETYYAEGTENPPSQTAYAVAIRFGLTDKKQEAGRFLRGAVEREGARLTTGFLGISHLCPALTATGNADTAYALLLQDKNPSWLYSVKNGATTIWERWNSYITETDTFGEVSMNSFNHYSYGAVGEWLFGSVLGISPLEAGYKKIRIAPVTGGGLKFASGFHDSPYGRIKSSWEDDGGVITLRCTVPANTGAVIEFGGETREVKAGTYEFAYAKN